ncbi:hypothetical protein BD779DRAFT_1671482 [Infundibulicybe gibba]|nr:hypothetical protein BD779DRAFT_1671482 [Infundibulicybe gibba]
MKFAALLAAATVIAGVSAVPSTANVDLSPYLVWTFPKTATMDARTHPGFMVPNQVGTTATTPTTCLTFLFSPMQLLDYYPPRPSIAQATPYPPSASFRWVYPNVLEPDGATQASDFLTFGLVDTITDHVQLCLGCNFVNTYHDVNGKGGSTQLTCSLFSLCHDASDADNRGGQSQPNGSVDFIIDSDGFCKSK